MQRKLTVSQLNSYISGVFEDEFVLHDVVVRGEIFELKVMGARTFFTLKEGGCTLNCVSFARIGGEVGMNADVTGTVTFYAKSGRVSFVAESLRVAGEGELLLELKKLKEKLEAEGLFANRPALPAVIRKAAVVTSEYGAVIHDILSVCGESDPAMNICICDVRVQGTDSAEAIARGIADVNNYVADADVIVVARGGGSASDLQPYNTEIVARAVASSRIPVISAVGHETDYTLCDLCASARAGTPSIAAAMICAPWAERTARVLDAAKALVRGVENIYSEQKHGILYSAMRVISLGERLTERRTSYVKGLLAKISALADAALSRRRERLAAVGAALEKLDPLKILSQGYAKVLRGGEELCGSDGLSAGDEVTVVMRDGRFTARVTKTEVGNDGRKDRRA